MKRQNRGGHQGSSDGRTIGGNCRDSRISGESLKQAWRVDHTRNVCKCGGSKNWTSEQASELSYRLGRALPPSPLVCLSVSPRRSALIVGGESLCSLEDSKRWDIGEVTGAREDREDLGVGDWQVVSAKLIELEVKIQHGESGLSGKKTERQLESAASGRSPTEPRGRWRDLLHLMG